MIESATVSVLMCVYNTPLKYLREAVESIRTQTYQDLEFIIVDDASADEDVRRYLQDISTSDHRIVLIRNPDNLGLTRSLNVGLPYCHGRYIARMDADDVSYPDRLQKQAAYLDSHENTSLVGSRITVIDADGHEDRKSVSDEMDVDPETYRIRSLLQHAGPPHPTFMFRASFLRKNGIQYREDIAKAQDYGIMADILKSGGQIDILNDFLLKYRVHSGQITSTSTIEQKAYQCRVSYDFVKHEFPELADEECSAISILGCGLAFDDLMNAVEHNEKLGRTCDHLLRDREKLDKNRVFIQAVKKMIRINNSHIVYEPQKFEKELRGRWWKLALRTTESRKRLWGMGLYTLLSYCFQTS